MTIRKSPGVAGASEIGALVASLVGDRRDVPLLLDCLAACGLIDAPERTPEAAHAGPSGDAAQQSLRQRLKRSVPLTGAIVAALVRQPQFRLTMAGLVEVLRERQASPAGDIDRRARAVVGWGTCAGLFFHDAASDVVHLGLYDQ